MDATLNGKPVEVFDRKQEKIDNSHDRMRLKMRMASTTEAGLYRRAIPDPMPETHRMACTAKWVDGPRGERVIELEIWPEVIPAAGPEQDAADPGVFVARTERKPLTPFADLTRTALEKLDRANLETKAVEMSVPFEKGWTDAKLIAAIVAAGKK
jgi:hypothetical protein